MLTIEAKIKNMEYYFNIHDEWVNKKEGKYIVGKLAKRFGIETVDRYTFEYILSLHEKRRNDGRQGIDMTFSVPKSVSVLAVMLGEDLVEAAHNEAVRETLEVHVEKLIETRVKEKGKRRYVQAEAAFICVNHYLNRNGDPQLHTHVLVPSTVWYEGEGSFIP